MAGDPGRRAARAAYKSARLHAARPRHRLLRRVPGDAGVRRQLPGGERVRSGRRCRPDRPAAAHLYLRRADPLFCADKGAELRAGKDALPAPRALWRLAHPGRADRPYGPDLGECRDPAYLRDDRNYVLRLQPGAGRRSSGAAAGLLHQTPGGEDARRAGRSRRPRARRANCSSRRTPTPSSPNISAGRMRRRKRSGTAGCASAMS